MLKPYFSRLLCVVLLTTAAFQLCGCSDTSNAGSNNSSPKNIVGFQLSTATPTVSVGDTFTLEVMINTGQEMTRGAQCGLIWTPAGSVNCIDMEQGDYYSDWGPQAIGASGKMAIHNDQGEIDQMAIFCTKAPADQGPSGKGVLFRYSFEALSSGSVNFTVAGTNPKIGDVGGEPIEIELADVSVTIE